ncbi:MAG TPA: hypothetical protein VFE88_04280 [Candidatus Nanoarchaeia archaeon]|nr:hypothetical protein [Candidatus Nanoarchaeia archaeon]
MAWQDFEAWKKGAAIGFIIWIFILSIFVFKYFYTRFFIESLGTTIKPFVYYGFGNIYLLLLSGIILVALGSLLGKIFGR